ncbi:Lrp/AsnC ligand binding domain-containing protein [Pseudomonas aeruginosa]
MADSRLSPQGSRPGQRAIGPERRRTPAQAGRTRRDPRLHPGCRPPLFRLPVPGDRAHPPLPGRLHEVERQIQDIAEFTECDKVTGDDCFIARLQVRSMEQLDTLLDRINGYAETNTAIVKKSPVKRRLPR